MGLKQCTNMSSRRFEPPSRSKFIIFQGEHKGPKNEIFISGAPNSLQPNFVIHVLIYILVLLVLGFKIVRGSVGCFKYCLSGDGRNF